MKYSPIFKEKFILFSLTSCNPKKNLYRIDTIYLLNDILIMLSIKNLSVQVEEKKILNQISFDFKDGKNYCILGKN